MVPCPECDVVAGRLAPAGGLLLDDGELVVHAVVGGTPVAGWVVVAPRTHVESLGELPPGILGRMTALAEKVAAAQRRELGAAKSYLALFAEQVPHLHLHVVPRYEDTPDRLRGARIFQSTAEDRIPESVAADAAQRIGRALAG